MTSAPSLEKFISLAPHAEPTSGRCVSATLLANTVQHSMIKVYLSAVRSLHIELGFADPLVDCLRLQ